jgi:hypothetical protein
MATLAAIAAVALLITAEMLAEWLLVKLRVPWRYRGALIATLYILAFALVIVANALGYWH